MTNYTDVLYEEKAGVARITINRSEKYNAFREKTFGEFIDALHKAAWNKAVGVVVLTGAGEKAFCTGMLVYPAGTNKQLVTTTFEAPSKVMQTTEVDAKIRQIGAIPRFSATPAEAASYTRSEYARWGDSVKRSGVQLE